MTPLLRPIVRGAVILLFGAALPRLAPEAQPTPWRISAAVGGGSWFREDVEAPVPKRGSRVFLALQLEHTLGGPFDLSLMGSAAAIPEGCAGGCGAAGRGLDLSVRSRLVPSRAPVWPYAFAGYGVLDQHGTLGRWHFGFGVDLRGPARVGLRLEGRYLYTPG